MKRIRTMGAALLALTLISGVRAQGGPPPLDMKAVALTAELFTAIRHGDKAATLAALEHGADPNRPNWLEMTPLDWAMMTGKPELAALLSSRGAKPEGGIYGSSVVSAVILGLDDQAVALLEKGVPSDSKRPDKATTLMLAAAFGAPKAIDKLKPSAAELAKQDIDGATALIYAARLGQVVTVKRLLAHGAVVDQADSHGRTPLMYAAMNGHKAVVTLLLAAGAKPNLTDKEKATALHLTARYCGDSTVAQSLLKAKASVSARDANGKTPIALAQARHFVGVTTVLKTAGARPEPVRAALKPDVAVQKSLVAMENGMKRFLSQSECASCHHQGLGVAVLGAARLKGFVVNQGILDGNVKRVADNLQQIAPLIGLSQSDPKLAGIVPTSEVDEMSIANAYLFWGLDGTQTKTSPEIAALAQYAATQQQPEGNWRFTLHRGPMQESLITATTLQLLGIKRYLKPEQSAPLLAKAQNWLKATPGKTTEDHAMRLLGLRWSGLETKALQRDAQRLIALQNTDGGWGAKPGTASDPMATGQALYSLRVAGASITDGALRQATNYLLRMQDESGAWYQNKTIQPFNYFFDTGFPGGESQYSSFGATGWATLGLIEMADRPKTARR